MNQCKFTFLNLRSIIIEQSKNELEDLFKISIDNIESILPINWRDEAENDDLIKYNKLKLILEEKLILEVFFENFSAPELIFIEPINQNSNVKLFPNLIDWEIERADLHHELIDGTYKDVLTIGIQFSIKFKINDVDIDDIYSNNEEVIEQFEECTNMSYWNIESMIFTENDPGFPKYSISKI